MANFDKALQVILNFEGSGYENVQGDLGGPTNSGISLAALKSYGKQWDLNHNGKIDSGDVKLLKPEQIKQIYKKEYWDRPFSLDTELSEKKALLLFDLCVNHGQSGSVALVQRALNAIGENLKVDGVFGPKTRAIIDKYDDKTFIDAVINYREKFYHKICEKDKSQRKFLNGWINHRVKRLSKILETY